MMKRRTLNILIMRMISGTKYKETNAFTLLIKSKEKDHSTTIKYRGPNPSQSTQKRERKKQNVSDFSVKRSGTHERTASSASKAGS
jgi:hypothetical protein